MHEGLAMLRALIFSFFFAFASLTPAQAQKNAPVPPGVSILDMGSMVMFTGTKGMTLYYFDGDKAGKSVCNGPCAQNWPPLLAGSGARPVGGFTIITRDDGTKQWAYKGRPLYYSKQDEQPGEMMGEGVTGWHSASP